MGGRCGTNHNGIWRKRLQRPNARDSSNQKVIRGNTSMPRERAVDRPGWEMQDDCLRRQAEEVGLNYIQKMLRASDAEINRRIERMTNDLKLMKNDPFFGEHK